MAALFELALLHVWLVGISLTLIASYLEYIGRSGWGLIFGIATLYLISQALNLDWLNIGIISAAYVPIGLLWSFWCWHRHCAKVLSKFNVNDLKKSSMNYDVTDSLRYVEVSRELDAERNAGKITLWVLNWPFSLIGRAVRDVFVVIDKFIDLICEQTFGRISKNAKAKLEKMAKEET